LNLAIGIFLFHVHDRGFETSLFEGTMLDALKTTVWKMLLEIGAHDMKKYGILCLVLHNWCHFDNFL
jgi:hypothetical protein